MPRQLRHLVAAVTDNAMSSSSHLQQLSRAELTIYLNGREAHLVAVLKSRLERSTRLRDLVRSASRGSAQGADGPLHPHTESGIADAIATLQSIDTRRAAAGGAGSYHASTALPGSSARLPIPVLRRRADVELAQAIETQILEHLAPPSTTTTPRGSSSSGRSPMAIAFSESKHSQLPVSTLSAGLVQLELACSPLSATIATQGDGEGVLAAWAHVAACLAGEGEVPRTHPLFDALRELTSPPDRERAAPSCDGSASPPVTTGSSGAAPDWQPSSTHTRNTDRNNGVDDPTLGEVRAAVRTRHFDRVATWQRRWDGPPPPNGSGNLVVAARRTAVLASIEELLSLRRLIGRVEAAVAARLRGVLEHPIPHLFPRVEGGTLLLLRGVGTVGLALTWAPAALLRYPWLAELSGEGVGGGGGQSRGSTDRGRASAAGNFETGSVGKGMLSIKTPRDCDGVHTSPCSTCQAGVQPEGAGVRGSASIAPSGTFDTMATTTTTTTPSRSAATAVGRGGGGGGGSGGKSDSSDPRGMAEALLVVREALSRRVVRSRVDARLADLESLVRASATKTGVQCTRTCT